MPSKYDFLYNIPDDIAPTDYYFNDNIVEAGANIIKQFRRISSSPIREVVAIAEMQSGKTDLMKRVIYLINNYNAEIKKLGVEIDKYKIYLVICASSINLKNQLKDKLPEIRQRIFHLNDIDLFLKNSYEHTSLFMEMADSSLVIFDESHCDAELEKVIDKFRKQLENYERENGTKYYRMSCSATPYEQITVNYPKVIMKSAPGYYGLRQMFAQNKKVPLLFQSKNLEIEEECENLFDEINICDYYYIIRLPNKKANVDALTLNIERSFRKRNKRFDSYIYDMNYAGNINQLLSVQPAKPTIIYLKDKLRMGEFLDTTFVYMVHDDPTNMYAHTTAQSLIGRCCGYNKAKDKTIIYCDFVKAWQHCRWIRHNYHMDYIPVDAKYIRKDNGATKANCMFKHMD